MRDLARITDQIADQLAARAGEVLHRMSPEGRRQRERAKARRRAAALRIAKRMVAAALAIILVAFAWGLLIAPLDVNGVILVMLLLIVTMIGVGIFSAPKEATPETLTQVDLPRLPAQTEAWLASQRPALPAPAARISDAIGTRLEAIGRQLHGIDAREPAAVELRKLIADDLPELIEGYKRVPQSLRRAERDGRPSPDRQLEEGLKLVDEQLGRMCETLASGDLHKLATQQRYLELKYRGGDETLGG